MNGFSLGVNEPRPLLKRPGLVAFIICLLLSSTVVVWRGVVQADRARSRARIEAQQAGAALASQFGQVLAAAELVSSAAAQSPSAVSNFERVASEVMGLAPTLANIEWQPNGITVEIVPRHGNERALGGNVFRDPARRQSAQQALKTRGPSVAAPVSLPSLEPGLTVLRPVFQRNASEPRESFLGFVAASMRLRQAWAGAHLEALPARGYSYAVLLAAGATQKGLILVQGGPIVLEAAVLQPIGIRNLEMRLAVMPQGGWWRKGSLTISLLLALGTSALIGLVVALSNRIAVLEKASTVRIDQPERDAPGYDRTQNDLGVEKARRADVESQLHEARISLQKSEANLAQVTGQLAAAERTKTEISEAAVAAQDLAEKRATQLQAQLDSELAARRDAERSYKRQMDQLRSQLEQVSQAATDLQSRMQAAAGAEKQALAAAEAQSQQATATITALQAQLKELTSPANQTSTPDQLQIERELQARLAQSEARAEELTIRLRETESELKSLSNSGDLKSKRTSSKPLPTNKTNQMDLFGARAKAGTVETLAPTDASIEEVAPETVLSPAAVEELKDSGALAKEDHSHVVLPEPEAEHTIGPEIKESKASPSRHFSRPPPAKMGELRSALHAILPLLADQDPGAKDCLKDNRAIFRVAFTPEGFGEFEELVRTGKFADALDQLRKAAKRCGISV